MAKIIQFQHLNEQQRRVIYAYGLFQLTARIF